MKKTITIDVPPGRMTSTSTAMCWRCGATETDEVSPEIMYKFLKMWGWNVWGDGWICKKCIEVKEKK